MLKQAYNLLYHYIISNIILLNVNISYSHANDIVNNNDIINYNNILPKCSKHGDTYGEWISTTDLFNSAKSHSINQTLLHKIESYFYPPNINNSVYYYSNIWLPNNCSYHRFTSETIHQCINYQLKSIYPYTLKPKLHIYFYGDSALRGIVNGILRILSGYIPNKHILDHKYIR